MKATDADALGTAKRRERDARKQAEGDLRAVVATPAGRRVIANLIDAQGVGLPVVVIGQPELTARNEGRRLVAIALRDAVKRLARADWLRLEQERLEREAAALPAQPDADDANADEHDGGDLEP